MKVLKRMLGHLAVTAVMAVMVPVSILNGKVLIIRNGGNYIGTYLSGRSIDYDEVYDYDYVYGVTEIGYDCVILSGGGDSFNDPDLDEEYKLIAAAPLPIYGICQGHQMISLEYGGVVAGLSGGGVSRQVINVDVFDLDELGIGYTGDSLSVYENHSYGLVAPIDGFTTYGQSNYGSGNNYCIEIMKHNERPLFSTQFHPEVTTSGNQGYIIMDWFLDEMVPAFWSEPGISSNESVTARVGNAFGYKITYRNPLSGAAELSFPGPLPGWLSGVGADSLAGIPDTAGTDTVLIVLSVGDTAYDTLGLRITVLPANLANENTRTTDSDNFHADNGVEGLWDGYVGSADGMNPGNSGIDSFWVEFDLGDTYSLEQVRLFGDGDGTWRSTLYSVRTRPDAAAAWTALIDREDCSGTRWYETGVDRDARYIRLTVIGDTVAHATQVREFEVYGAPGGTGVTEIPLSRGRRGTPMSAERTYDLGGRRVVPGIRGCGPAGVCVRTRVREGKLTVEKQLWLR